MGGCYSNFQFPISNFQFTNQLGDSSAANDVLNFAKPGKKSPERKVGGKVMNEALMMDHRAHMAEPEPGHLPLAL